MQIDVNLSKEGIGETMVDETIKGMSLDGFMNITSTDSSGNIVRTDENGTLSMYVMPGSWTLFISGDDFAKMTQKCTSLTALQGWKFPSQWKHRSLYSLRVTSSGIIENKTIFQTLRRNRICKCHCQ